MQLFALLPLLEQAPDQIASRPFDTVNVIEVPVANEADPVDPTATLIPAGLEVMRSPLRPVAVTVSVAEGGAGLTVSVAGAEVPPAAAETVEVVAVPTEVVAMVNVAEVAPAGTVTLAGTDAAALLLESATETPPAGAAELSVTVPFELVPPLTLVGLRVRDATPGPDACGLTVSVAERVTPPPVTEIVTSVCVVTACVKMLKPPAVEPAGIVTLFGTDATAGLLLET